MTDWETREDLVIPGGILVADVRPAGLKEKFLAEIRLGDAEIIDR
jgi:hypothetical protein